MTHQQKKIIGSVILTSLLYPSVTSAEGLTPLQEEIRWLQEETFVTTATKTLESIKKTGASVSVITSDDLKNMGARNLMDALKKVPGLGIYTTSIGIPTVEVRGVKTDSSEKVLFLFNGHAVNNNLINGGATWDFGHFQVKEIERIEIVRGPGSALYGANAFVAVINIVTKTATDTQGTEISAGLGQERTKTLNLHTGQEQGALKYAVNINILDTNGIDEKVASDGFGNSGRTDYWEKRYDLGFNATYNEWTIQGKYLDRAAGPFIGIGNTLNDESKQAYIGYFLELAYNKKLTENLSLEAKLYHDHFQADNYWEIFPENFPGFGGGAFPEGTLGSPTVEDEKFGTEIQFDFAWGDSHKLLAGALFEHQTQFNVRHITNFNPITFAPEAEYLDVSDKWNWNSSNDRDVSALYLQDIWDISETLRLIMGARADHYSDFGSAINPRSSINWEFVEGYTMTAAYGEAFRAPNFGELYNINNPSITGNPDLEPEEIETYEVSILGSLSKRTSFKVTGFKNNIRDVIKYIPSGSENVSANVGELQITGIEVEYSTRFRNGSDIQLNYTYQYPLNELTNQRESEVPLHKANAAFNYRYSTYLNTYVGVHHRGKLRRAAGDSRSGISDITTLDLAVNWQNQAENFGITATLYNLLDNEYVDPAVFVASDFPAQGRNFMVEASYKM